MTDRTPMQGLHLALNSAVIAAQHAQEKLTDAREVSIASVIEQMTQQMIDELLIEIPYLDRGRK